MSLPLDRLPDALGDLRKAYDFAGVVALSRTAVKARDEARKALEDEFTLRNEYSKRSIQVKTATMQTPEAEVFVRDQYLADQELGATRDAKPEGQPIPIEIYRAAGIDSNRVIPKSLRRSALARGKAAKALVSGNKPFTARSKNATGVWVRETKKRLPILPLYFLVEGARKIAKRPWFRKSVEDSRDRFLPDEFEKAIDESLDRWLQRHAK